MFCQHHISRKDRERERVRETERDNVCMCVRERERERGRDNIWDRFPNMVAVANQPSQAASQVTDFSSLPDLICHTTNPNERTCSKTGQTTQYRVQILRPKKNQNEPNKTRIFV